jgi:sugar phosphate isomerase/epimerase
MSSSERFLEGTPSDCVGLTVDFSNLSFAGEQMPQVIARLGDRIHHTHIKNGWVDPQGGWHFGPLDEGLTDYAEVLALLQSIGYEGYLSIECLGPDAQTLPARTAQRDLAILQRYLAEIGDRKSTTTG